MKKLRKSMDWMVLVSGILMIILGALMLVMPVKSLIWLAVVVGLWIVISGVAELMNTMAIPEGQRSGWMVFESLLTVAIGVWMIFGNGIDALWIVFPFLNAGLMMINGVIRMDGAMTMKRQGLPKWKWLVALGALETGLGGLLLFSPVYSAQLGSIVLALLLVTYGASNIALSFNAQKVADFFRGFSKRMSAVSAD